MVSLILNVYIIYIVIFSNKNIKPLLSRKKYIASQTDSLLFTTLDLPLFVKKQIVYK